MHQVSAGEKKCEGEEAGQKGGGIPLGGDGKSPRKEGAKGSREQLSGVLPGTHWALEVQCWGVELVVGWGVWCTVIVTVTISTTAPISKKQKKEGMKYLAKILWESSL